jgi:hypothetical protein
VLLNNKLHSRIHHLNNRVLPKPCPIATPPSSHPSHPFPSLHLHGPLFPHLLEFRHNHIPQHRRLELLRPKVTRMRPRLQPHLLPNRPGKTSTPSQPRPPAHHMHNRVPMHQPPDGLFANIIKNRRELDQRGNAGDGACFPQVLVPYHGFGDGFGLRGWRVEPLQEAQR